MRQGLFWSCFSPLFLLSSTMSTNRLPIHIIFFLQDYIDSMEGAALSGRQCAGEVLAEAPKLASAASA